MLRTSERASREVWWRRFCATYTPTSRVSLPDNSSVLACNMVIDIDGATWQSTNIKPDNVVARSTTVLHGYCDNGYYAKSLIGAVLKYINHFIYGFYCEIQKALYQTM